MRIGGVWTVALTCSDQSAPERGDAAEFHAAKFAGTRTRAERLQISPTKPPRSPTADDFRTTQ